MEPINYQFKINNPYKPDEVLTQDVIISTQLQYDYSQSEWVGIDAEFLGLNRNRDKLCCIQIASPHPENKEQQRVEIIYTYNQPVDERLKMFLKTKTEKIFHVFSADMPMIDMYTRDEMSGPVFDTKVAAKIVWTNGPSSSLSDFVEAFIDPKFEKMKKAHARWELEPKRWTKDMIEYATRDVLYLHPAKLKFEEIAKERERLDLLQETMTTLPTIARLFKEGYDVNVFTFN